MFLTEVFVFMNEKQNIKPSYQYKVVLKVVQNLREYYKFPKIFPLQLNENHILDQTTSLETVQI